MKNVKTNKEMNYEIKPVNLETYLRRQIYLNYITNYHGIYDVGLFTNNDDIERLKYDELATDGRNKYVIKIRHPETFINYLLQKSKPIIEIERMCKSTYDIIFPDIVSLLKEAHFNDMYIVEQKSINYLIFDINKWKDDIEIMTGETLTNP
jgi:hypothetical protein